MQYTQELKNIERVGVTRKTQCSIMINAKAFEMLARQYSYPIKAIVQELSANAFDSHVRANKANVPFYVKLPNKLDPHFKIRDYGVSMSPEIIYDVYINYMKSDKTATNNEVGYFGIGSKTPFAYTDSFNITTYLDGYKRLYTLAYNEVGIPELNEFEAVTTDEKNGVEISFAVKSDDFNSFCDVAKEVFSFFVTKPTVVGNTNYEHVYHERLLEGEGWYFVKKDRRNQSYAIMGNVAYPITAYNFYDDTREILNLGIVVNFNIGDLNVTPSREALEYTDNTTRNIKKVLSGIKKEISAKITDRIQDSKNYWDACINAKEFTRVFDFVKPNTITWKGKAVRDSFDGIFIDRTFVLNSSSNRIKTEVYKKASHVWIAEDTRIVVRDMDRKAIARTKYFCKKTDTKVYFIDLTEEAQKFDVEVSADNVVRDLTKLLGIGDNNIIFKTSDLDDAPKAPRAKSAGGKREKTSLVTALEFDLNGSNYSKRKYNSRYWIPREVDLANDTVWVNISNYDVEKTAGISGIGHLVDIVNTLTKLGVTVPKIYGFTTTQVKKVEKSATCVNFNEWVKTVCTKNTTTLLEEIVSRSTVRVNSELFSNIRFVTKYKTTTIQDGSVFSALCDAVAKFKTKENDVSEYFVNYYKGVTGETLKTDAPEITKLIHRASKRYPLVTMFLGSRDFGYMNGGKSDIANSVVSTVNAIDSVTV